MCPGVRTDPNHPMKTKPQASPKVYSTVTPDPASPIGRTCIVQDTKHHPAAYVEARVIERDPKTNHAKRIRLLTGEHYGEVRNVGEYRFVEFCEHSEAAGVLASVWPD